jgi:hypothetical protein
MNLSNYLFFVFFFFACTLALLFDIRNFRDKCDIRETIRNTSAVLSFTSNKLTQTSDWARSIFSRPWDGFEEKNTSSCKNIHKKILPSALDISSSCHDPKFSVDSSSWQPLMNQLLSTPCIYFGTSSQRRYIWNLPSQDSDVFLVFAQAQPPNELPHIKSARKFLSKWTLTKLREQFGNKIEITVVNMFDDFLDEERDFGRGVVNTAISHLNIEGVDFGMYQEGLQSAMHRIHQFKWVIVMNDQMVGPFANLSHILSLSASSDLYVASSWGGCCIRGFFIAYSQKLVSTPLWKTYWERIAFPCGKLGAMFLGEGAMSRPPLLWSNCMTSTTHPLSSGDSLETMKSTHSPFLYRKGLVSAFVENMESLTMFLSTYSVIPRVENCRVRWR